VTDHAYLRHNEDFSDMVQMRVPDALVEAADTPVERFPWPPGEAEKVIAAAAATWQWSLFEPSGFFRAMPTGNYLTALSYCVLVCVLGAGLHLFWNALDLALPFSAWPGPDTTLDNPALQRLVSFLFTPVTTLVVLFVAATVVHAALKVLGAARKPLVATTRVLAFATGPVLLAIVPVVGPFAALVWGLILTVVGLREVHHTTTARAAAALVASFCVLLSAIVVLMLSTVLLTVLGWALALP
jgi:hypothetical protein